MTDDVKVDGLVEREDGRCYCWWGESTADYQRYHDREWGWPVKDDRRLFEKICLEGFQSGLSWLTILRKRPGFRAAFADFDFAAVARYGDADVERLLQDASIVRHRKKIESTINNAKRALDLVAERGSLAAYFWAFEPPADERPTVLTKTSVPSKTPTSTRLSRDLKKRGWSFVGPTTAYAFMQAMGLVNDHLAGCATRSVVETRRSRFRRPEPNVRQSS